MGHRLTARPVPGDWNGVINALMRLDHALNTGSSPTFGSFTLSDLTASRLVNIDANKKIESVVDLADYIAGTANEITVTDDGDGTVTLSTPQDIHTGASPTFDGLTLSNIANESSDVDKFLVDSSGVIKYRTGAELLSDIGGSGGSHLHDGDTLQHDAINSDGGAFSFTTTGLVTFTQSITSANYTAANLLTVCTTNAGAIDFSAASKTLTVEDDAIVSQDYSTDAAPTFAGLIPYADDAYDLGLIEESEPEFSLVIEQAETNSEGSVGSTLRGTTFTTEAGFDLGKVAFMLKRSPEGSGDVTLHLSETDEGVPIGDDLASVTIDGTSISNSVYEWTDFELETPYTLSGATMYAVWISAVGYDYSQKWLNGTAYDGGTYIQLSPPWTAISSYEGTFRVYSTGETEGTYTRWQNLYLSGVLHDGTVSLSVANAKDAYDFTTALNAATDGQLMIGDTGNNPVLATLTGTADQITVTGGAGGTFTGVVTGVTPTDGSHLATKEYVDLAIGVRKTFFLSDTGSGVGSLNYMYPHETEEAESTIVSGALGLGDDQLIKGFITEAGQPGISTLTAGVITLDLHAKKGESNQRTTVICAVLSKVDADGTSNKTTIITSECSAELTNAETIHHIHAALSEDVELDKTSRLILDVQGRKMQ